MPPNSPIFEIFVLEAFKFYVAVTFVSVIKVRPNRPRAYSEPPCVEPSSQMTQSLPPSSGRMIECLQTVTQVTLGQTVS